MRRFVVLTLVALLVAPASALAFTRALGDGTLAVRAGEGIVRLDLRGAVIGRLAHGTLVVVDPEAGDCANPLVWEWEDLVRRIEVNDGERQVACYYRGSSIRFRFVGGQNEIRLNGRGIAISAVGRGTAYIKGSKLVENDGTFSINGAPFVSLPDDGDRFRITASP